MNSTEARNHFILNHYHRLMRISKICARRIQKIFPMVSVDDLQGFAFEGMIVALDKADLVVKLFSDILIAMHLISL